LEEAQEMAIDHTLYPVGPYTHRIRRRVLDPKAALIEQARLSVASRTLENISPE
jgi:hypothetical protein